MGVPSSKTSWATLPGELRDQPLASPNPPLISLMFTCRSQVSLGHTEADTQCTWEFQIPGFSTQDDQFDEKPKERKSTSSVVCSLGDPEMANWHNEDLKLTQHLRIKSQECLFIPYEVLNLPQFSQSFRTNTGSFSPSANYLRENLTLF